LSYDSRHKKITDQHAQVRYPVPESRSEIRGFHLLDCPKSSREGHDHDDSSK
jgi:hypothetical protein